MAAASSPSCTIDTIDPNLPVQQEVSAVDSGFSNISHARTLDIAGIVYEKYLKQHRVNFLEGCLNFDKSYSTNNAKLKKWLPELLQQGRRYDLIFIDGLHNEHAVLSDLIASSQLLAANGCILLHDARFRWAEEILYGVVKFFEINTDFTAHRYEAGSVMKLTRRT
jgi:hypothetical protein